MAPGAHGWSTELWTLERVADMIAMETGVRYHIGHVSRILRRLGWSWQKPAQRPNERDEKGIARGRPTVCVTRPGDLAKRDGVEESIIVG